MNLVDPLDSIRRPVRTDELYKSLFQSLTDHKKSVLDIQRAIRTAQAQINDTNRVIEKISVRLGATKQKLPLGRMAELVDLAWTQVEKVNLDPITKGVGGGGSPAYKLVIEKSTRSGPNDPFCTLADIDLHIDKISMEPASKGPTDQCHSTCACDVSSTSSSPPRGKVVNHTTKREALLWIVYDRYGAFVHVLSVER